MPRTLPFLFIAVALAGAAARAVPGQPAAATTVIANARVFTGVDASPWAQAVAVRGDRILAVGTNDEVRKAAGEGAAVIDAQGRLLIPGINDAHAHPGTYPEAVRLEGPPAMEEDPSLATVLERLRVAVARAPRGGWITGDAGPALIGDPGSTRFALDAVAPDHPVMVASWTGHGTLFNTAALRRLGVSDTEPDPPGGSFVRMPGKPVISGVAHEYAEFRLRQQMTMSVPRERQLAAIRSYTREISGLGITSIQAMLTAGPPWFMAPFLTGDDVPVRARLIDFPMAGPGAWAPAPSAAGAPVPGVKWVLDGTPLERLAAMRRPYADADTRGRLNFTPEELSSLLRRALAAGVQPMVHIAGDRAMDVALDALEATGGEKWRALRPRLEHGELFLPDHAARARRVGAVLVVNPSHFMIAGVVNTRLGSERAAAFGAVKMAIEAGIPLAIGSDGPDNPFLNIMFATLHPGNPGQALSREQALLAYTRGAAYAELQEQSKGTIAAGMLADLALLSQDILTVPPDALPGTTSVLTMVGGRIVHKTM